LAQIYPVLISALDHPVFEEIKVPKGINLSLLKTLAAVYFVQQQVGLPNLVCGGLFILAFTKQAKD
jgi:hypothetical protein